MVTALGRQEQAAVGYNPCYRGKRSYHPLLCLEANSSYLLFLLPGQVTRPQNRPVLRLKQSAFVEELSTHILSRVAKLKPLQA